MPKPPTITDIAKLAGVSRSTVSRVLTDNRNVKRETVLRVRRAMEQANYRPNVLARGLATGKLNIVAMLISEADSPFYPQIVDHMDRELRQRGYILNLCYLGRDERARIETFRIIQEYGFSGYVVADVKDEPGFVEEIRRVGRPLVFCNRYIENMTDFDAVVVDNYFGGYLAGRHLLELGHRDVATITGPIRSSASRDRFRGFRDALAEYGLELPTDLVEEGDLTLASGQAFAEKFFPTRLKRFTAVFAGNDMMALGVLNYCRERGVSVPGRLSLVGFDDSSYAGSALVNLTTVQQPLARMGALTAERIVARIKGEDSPRQCVMLEPKLIVRKTTGPV